MHSSDTSGDHRSITILLADDDEDDRVLTAGALRRARMLNDIRFVETLACSWFDLVALPRDGDDGDR
jgi:hypothetical protein